MNHPIPAEARFAQGATEDKRPMCHFTPMDFECGDDGCQQVTFWECRHCGHTIEIDRVLAG